jgi:NADH-quinone oxidoreductase subunit K
MSSPLLILATALLVVGLTGALVRRSLLVSLLCTELALLGGVTAFFAFALPAEDPGGIARAAVLLFLCAAHALLGAAVAIAVYRRRGTLNLDELRELRG